MSNDNVAVIRCPVNQFHALREILFAYQSAEHMNAMTIDQIDFDGNDVTIIGQNVTAMLFHLTIMGYEAKAGPKKTHLFITIKEKK
jgi:hypothetical protein